MLLNYYLYQTRRKKRMTTKVNSEIEEGWGGD